MTAEQETTEVASRMTDREMLLFAYGGLKAAEGYGNIKDVVAIVEGHLFECVSDEPMPTALASEDKSG